MAHGIALSLTLVDVLSTGAGCVLLRATGGVVWRGRQAGKALLTLAWAPHTLLYGALTGVFTAILLVRALDPHLRQPALIFLNLAWAAFCLAHIANRFQVRERGIVANGLFLPWPRIVSYMVGAPADDRGRSHGASLTIRYYPSHPSLALVAEERSTTIRCAGAKREEIELLLARHVRTDQGHRRWHARRVRAVGPISAAPAAR